MTGSAKVVFGETARRVLVVDPNAHIRRLIKTLMGALEVREVVEARDTATAAARMAPCPQLVILDWTGDPTEPLLFVHRLRRGEFGCPSIPVLGLATSTHHAVLERAWEAGIDDVIAKPLSAVELINRAGQLMDERLRSLAAE